MRFSDTLKLKLKAIAKSRLTLRCPKHTRYNPAEGRGAIRGRCAGCEDAYEAYEAVIAFHQALARYAVVTEKFEMSKPRSRKSKPVTPDVSDQTQGWINVIKKIGANE